MGKVEDEMGEGQVVLGVVEDLLGLNWFGGKGIGGKDVWGI